MKRIKRVEVVVEEGGVEERIDVRTLHVPHGGAVLLALPAGFDHVDVMRMMAITAEKSGVEFLGVHPSLAGFADALVHEGLVVSAVVGYEPDPSGSVRSRRVGLLLDAGFERFESDAPARCEMFVLAGPWAAKGPVAGKSVTAIRQWVMQEIRPGMIEVVAQRWGLGPG
ncbi:MAG: hypothetical protein EKK55_24460 [Rhodocyclaceae bacterium]|nr:MAG: hypothetical protein EKK55_24460 [Rhodocyclaceae bacterium]